MQNAGSIEIDCPIDLVFKLTNDHVAEWSIIVIKDEVIEETPDIVGSTFRTITEERGTQMEFLGTVIQYDPPKLSEIELIGKSFDIHARYRFEDLGGDRTRVTQESSVQGKGLIKLFFLVFGWLMRSSGCKALNDELESLKSYCEQFDSAKTDSPEPAHS